MTVSQLATLLGVPRHRIEYLIRDRRITSASRVGNVRLYDEAACQQIRSELTRRTEGGRA